MAHTSRRPSHRSPAGGPGAGWAIEDLFEPAKGECGVRSWTGWHRHVTLSLWALEVVAVIRLRRPAPRRTNGAMS